MQFLVSYIIYIIIFLLFIPLITFIAIILFFTQGLPIIHWSKRIGKNNKLFMMPKFRTMHNDTPNVATHLLKDPKTSITKIGSFLRKYSLDETPQVISLIQGNMSLVGPRPALFNQDDLIKLRKNKKIHELMPGITGLAQISGRDNLTIEKKVEYDYEYLTNKSILLDLKIIFLTVLRVLKIKDISH